MVLTEKFGAKPRASLVTRTVLYVLGFTFGSLLVAGVLSFTLMRVAESAFAPKPDKSAKAVAPEIIGAPPVGQADEDAKPKTTPLGPKPSKARRPRANEAADATKGTDQPL